MMLKRMIAGGAAALAGCGLMAGAAWAATAPTFRTDLIVPNHSVAGISLKADHAAAVKAFVSGGRSCSSTKGCSYELKDESSFTLQFVQLKAHGTPIVGQIVISAGLSATGTRTYGTPLVALKTASGIGLGSTVAALRRAYPQARKAPSSTSSSASFTIVGHGDLGTTFICADGRVAIIQMTAVHLG